jgi:oligoribonuclease NrnB/cAMP/cGMP phosphodiesterase (DHH superfamily)
MKIKLFTHTDLDGVGCAIVARHAFGNNVDVEYCDYNEINDKVSEFIKSESQDYNMIFITDISVDENVAKEIENNISDKLKLIDHHPTAKWLNKYKWVTVEEFEASINHNEEYAKASGTSLFYSYLWENYGLNNELLFELVEKIRRYDTWEWSTKYNDVHAKQLNDLLYIVGRNNFVNRFANDPSIKLRDNETFLLNIEQDRINNYIKKKAEELKRVNILNYKAGVVFAEQYHSELGNELAKQNPDLDFIAIINMASNKVSYRGIKDDIDLGKDVAKIFGGGGHPKAAGSQFDEELTSELIKKIFSVK